MKGKKDMLGKPDYTLIDPYFLEGMVNAMEKGKVKYARQNWQTIHDPHKLMAAAMRHLFAVHRGEFADNETGMSHLLHVACNMMFLYYHERHAGGWKSEYE